MRMDLYIINLMIMKYKNLFHNSKVEYLEDEYPREIKIIYDCDKLINILKKCFQIKGE